MFFWDGTNKIKYCKKIRRWQKRRGIKSPELYKTEMHKNKMAYENFRKLCLLFILLSQQRNLKRKSELTCCSDFI
jgi:hypothetical protein